MPVPKKRCSKAKKNIRKAHWKKKALQNIEKAFSLSLSERAKERLPKREPPCFGPGPSCVGFGGSGKKKSTRTKV